MTVVVAHPTGNANVRAVLRGMSRAGLLDSFWTSLAVPPPLVRVFPPGSRIARELGRREFGEVPWAKIRVAPQREALRLAAGRLGCPLTKTLVRRSRAPSVDAVYRHLDRSVARYLRGAAPPGVLAVYAYEDGALASFQAADDTGRRKIYELPIAHWRTLHRVLGEERERHPEWAGTLAALQDGPEKLRAKDAELLAADVVVVASSFTQASVTASFGDRVRTVVVPYGAPALRVARPAERKRDAPLRIMFAGHLDARKGVPDLIAALKMLEVPWTATLAGRLPAHVPGALKTFLGRPDVTFLGHVPHRTLLGHMQAAHVLVLPSLVEGFGLVLAEAMAAGLAVVTTPHTAGPDLIADGCDGFIVPVRDPGAIAARLTRLHDDEPSRLAMAAAALRAAAATPWRAYEDTVAALARAA